VTGSIGPPPAGPLVCFPCACGQCLHSADTRRSSAHGGGLVPAITTWLGTALCLDCAMDPPPALRGGRS
jgi:energy-converting hydrogenase Eha subunit B